jgi:hypothetical protein
MTTLIHATSTDNLAPLAYLGRITPNDRGWTAERTDWDDYTADANETSLHIHLNTFTGANAEERAGQAILNTFDIWKRTQ